MTSRNLPRLLLSAPAFSLPRAAPLSANAASKPPPITDAEARRLLAPSGTLRAGINLSNILLVTSRGADGEPQGVSPDMAAAFAARLGVPLQLVPYKNPGLLGDAVENDEWDIGNIGAEPQRAKLIAFSSPYSEIQATYLVPDGSAIKSIPEVDVAGVRVAVSARAAYCLWLENNLEHATLKQTAEPGLDLSRQLFLDEQLEVLAGLRPWLLTQAESLPGARILDGSFTSVRQAIGIPRTRGEAAAAFVEGWVQEALASGLVQTLIEKHQVDGRLSVAR